MTTRRKQKKPQASSRAQLTHLDKIFWPKEKFTKGDVIGYYDRVADFILPYLRDRPMVLHRHPNGIRGESFYQKNVETLHLPPFVKTVSIRAESTGKIVRYIVCNNKQTLLYLANLGCIGMHPWISRTANLRHADFLSLDLDPGGNAFGDIVKVARAVRDVVEEAGGHCLVKTSGKNGIHVIVPLGAGHDFTQVRDVARTIARIVGRRLPHLTTPRPNAGRRSHKIYIDYVRNSFGQTLAAPYSLRAAEGASISTPLEWRELTASLTPKRYTLRTIFRRLQGKGDVWATAIHRPAQFRSLAKRLQKIDAATAGAVHARHRAKAR